MNFSYKVLKPFVMCKTVSKLAELEPPVFNRAYVKRRLVLLVKTTSITNHPDGLIQLLITVSWMLLCTQDKTGNHEKSKKLSDCLCCWRPSRKGFPVCWDLLGVALSFLAFQRCTSQQVLLPGTCSVHREGPVVSMPPSNWHLLQSTRHCRTP